MNSFLIEYKVAIDLVRGLKGVITSHELPVGASVQVGEAVFNVLHAQPVVLRYFPKTKKLHYYYDGFRIYDGHTCCQDRGHLKQNVVAVLSSFGISSFDHLQKSFRGMRVDEYLEYEDKSFKKFNCFRFQLWLNHFDSEVELIRYK